MNTLKLEEEWLQKVVCEKLEIAYLSNIGDSYALFGSSDYVFRKQIQFSIHHSICLIPSIAFRSSVVENRVKWNCGRE